MTTEIIELEDMCCKHCGDLAWEYDEEVREFYCEECGNWETDDDRFRKKNIVSKCKCDINTLMKKGCQCGGR